MRINFNDKLDRAQPGGEFSIGVLQVQALQWQVNRKATASARQTRSLVMGFGGRKNGTAPGMDFHQWWFAGLAAGRDPKAHFGGVDCADIGAGRKRIAANYSSGIDSGSTKILIQDTARMYVLIP